MDSDCYYVKLSVHVQREVAAKPELVQIETAYRSPKERQPGTLSRNEYTDLEAHKDESEDGENIPTCEASKTTIVVYGDGAGTTRRSAQTPTAPFIIRAESLPSTQRPRLDNASLKRSKPDGSEY
jgi:hypothetical protein